jgi:hypothetical protein
MPAKRTKKPRDVSKPPETGDAILESLNSAERNSQAVVKILRASDLIPFVRVLDPEGVELKPMEPWLLALELLNDFWPKHKRTIINKVRQMGVSWDCALYCLDHCQRTAYRTLGSVNYNREAASELIWRMKVLWSTLPPTLRIPAEWATDHVTFANGSRAIALPTKDVAGAGLTFTVIVIDEAGLIENLAENWAAILPAVDKGELHLFSTPRGATNKFATLVTAARKGEGPFKLREIDYWERPDRDQNTEQGRAWLAARKAELSEREFGREYGREFTRPGTGYFDDALVKKMRALCVAPKQVIWPGGRLKIWETPDPKDKVPQFYVIGADVAEGLEDGDYSAATVLNRRTGRTAATYHAHVGVTDYAENLVKLAKLYGNAWLAIEANNHGHAVCAWVYKHCKYRRVCRESHEGEGQIGGPSRTRLGILTTESSKPAMLAVVEHGLRKGLITVLDLAVVEELAGYLCLPGGGYGAAPGQHDDRVMGLLLAQDGRGRPFPRSM